MGQPLSVEEVKGAVNAAALSHNDAATGPANLSYQQVHPGYPY
jgi:hypothetical protein